MSRCLALVVSTDLYVVRAVKVGSASRPVKDVALASKDLDRLQKLNFVLKIGNACVKKRKHLC